MPFSDVLTPLLARLRTRYAQSRLPGYLAWWWGELRSCLPRAWQKALRQQEAEVQIRLDGERPVVEVVAAGSRHEITRLDGEDEFTVERLVELLGERAESLPRVVLLPAQAVLTRRLSFPASAVGNVRALVGFEIDRQTPFRADQVEFDCRLLAIEEGAKQIGVELGVVCKETLAQLTRPLAKLERHLDVVDVIDAEGRRGFNLLPPERRRVRDQRPLLINLALAGFALICLLLAMGQLVENRRDAVLAMEQEVEAQRAQARATSQLRKGLSEAIKAASFLAEQRQNRPGTLEMLRVLTQALPDDTFVESLAFNGDDITLTVQSGSAAKLVDLFQKTPQLRNPAVAGTILPDQRSGKDRLTLTAKVLPKTTVQP